METLPLEILEKISENLSVKDLAACAAVCSQWRDLFNSDLLWKPKCNTTLVETLRTTPCVVEPFFVSPEIDGGTLSPIGQWRLASMRENHLWNNWRTGNRRVASVPIENICHTFFISNDIILRIYDSSSSLPGIVSSLDAVFDIIKLYDLKTFPPTLLNETTNRYGGWVTNHPNIVSLYDNTLVIFYDQYSVAYNLDLNTKSILEFKFKINLPMKEFSGGLETAPRFEATPKAILGINPVKYSISETLHIWDMKDGTQLTVETSPLSTPYGFTDVITSKTTENAVIVVSNDVNCETFTVCLHHETRKEIPVTYNFHIYNSVELCYLPFVEVREAEHRIRYRCKIHHDYVAIAINDHLKIYNYRSHTLLTEEPVTYRKLLNKLMTTSLEVIDDCFAFICDKSFKMFHPASRTSVVLVELQIKEFNVINNAMVEMVKDGEPREIWKIGRHYQTRLRIMNHRFKKTNEASTRTFTESPSGSFNPVDMALCVGGLLKRPTFTEWSYFW